MLVVGSKHLKILSIIADRIVVQFWIHTCTESCDANHVITWLCQLQCINVKYDYTAR